MFKEVEIKVVNFNTEAIADGFLEGGSEGSGEAL